MRPLSHLVAAACFSALVVAAQAEPSLEDPEAAQNLIGAMHKHRANEVAGPRWEQAKARVIADWLGMLNQIESSKNLARWLSTKHVAFAPGSALDSYAPAAATLSLNDGLFRGEWQKLHGVGVDDAETSRRLARQSLGWFAGAAQAARVADELADRKLPYGWAEDEILRRRMESLVRAEADRKFPGDVRAQTIFALPHDRRAAFNPRRQTFEIMNRDFARSGLTSVLAPYDISADANDVIGGEDMIQIGMDERIAKCRKNPSCIDEARRQEARSKERIKQIQHEGSLNAFILDKKNAGAAKALRSFFRAELTLLGIPPPEKPSR